MTGILEILEHIVTEPDEARKLVLAGDVQGPMWHNAASENCGYDFWAGSADHLLGHFAWARANARLALKNTAL